MNAFNVAYDAAMSFGGLAEEPNIVFKESHEPEVLEPAPRFQYAHPRFLRYKPHPIRWDLESPKPISIETEEAESHTWAMKLWIPDHEVFDSETNTLMCYGYYRVYSFPIWTQIR